MDIATKTFSSKQFALPRHLPMIVLEGCYHFPGCHLPLFIFEERYRLMLDHALRTDRMFCVGVAVGGDILPVTTAGLIRASVKGPDGTSQVMLYGVSRVRIKGWIEQEPFRIAEIEPFHTEETPPGVLLTLKQEALELLPDPSTDSCDSMQLLRQSLEDMQEAETVCDVMAFHFIRRKAVLRALLEDASPQRRYERLISELRKTKD
jgi:Lon protease-like protein